MYYFYLSRNKGQLGLFFQSFPSKPDVYIFSEYMDISDYGSFILKFFSKRNHNNTNEGIDEY